jgi:enoyl-CoA hydratase/3-hydroxyacyl-CoA dehydrogenase
MNEVGVGRAAEMVLSLTERWQLEPPTTLSTRAAEGRPFEFCRVRSEVRDRVATLTVHRPDSNNALDEQVVTQLADAFHGAASDPDVEGIVLAGSGSSFVGGVDVGFFLRQIERRDLDPILELTHAIHLLLSSIENCPKPVVARVHGPALGGGLEIALACRFIVATPQARFGFPETGLGIYPGLGGTQRTARKIGVGLTKALVFTGERIDSFEAASIGLADAVVPHTRLDETIRAVIAGATLDPGPRRLDSDWAALARFFEHHAVEDIRTGRIDTEDRAVLVRAVEQLGTKSPMALRVAERLIDEGIERPLHEGLHMELEYVREVFGSHDAYEGLSAVGARVPEFEGR